MLKAVFYVFIFSEAPENRIKWNNGNTKYWIIEDALVEKSSSRKKSLWRKNLGRQHVTLVLSGPAIFSSDKLDLIFSQ